MRLGELSCILREECWVKIDTWIDPREVNRMEEPLDDNNSCSRALRELCETPMIQTQPLASIEAS
jgi:hypothetical protein